MKKKIVNFINLEISKNVIWLFLDKFIRLGIGLLVGVLIARYIGPELFGKWNYAIALIGLVSVFSTLGIDQVVVKDLLNKYESEHILLGTAFYLRLLGTFISSFIVVFIFLFFKTDNFLFLISVLTALNLWFQTFDVIDLKNQSVLESKKTVVAKNSAFVIISIIKLLLIYLKLPLLYFVFFSLIEFILGAIILIFNYGFCNVKLWRFNFAYSKSLLKNSWPLILSGIIIMLYMRIDQIMIGEMIGEKKLGYYSVSTKFTELWYFIPTAFATSFFPKLLEKFNFEKENYPKLCLKLFKLVFVISFSIAVFFTFFSELIIKFLFGIAYIQSVFTLQISIWTGIFVFLGVVASNMLLIENLNKHNLNKSIQGLLLNVFLNIFLIPKYGINGAAVATLISQFYASYFYFLLYKKTRHIFLLQTKSILFL